MAVTISVESDGESVFMVAVGAVSSEELLQANREFFEGKMDCFRRVRTWLSDYSEASLVGVSSEAIAELADLSIRVSKENPDLLVAIIVPRDLSFALARMWESMSDGTAWTTKVFRTEAEAREWLRLESSRA